MRGAFSKQHQQVDTHVLPVVNEAIPRGLPGAACVLILVYLSMELRRVTIVSTSIIPDMICS